MKKRNLSFILFIITLLLLGGVGGGTTTAQITFQKTFGGGALEYAESVRQTSDNGYIIVGTSRTFSFPDKNIYLIKTDYTGNMEWSKTFGGSDWDFGKSVIQSQDKGYVIAGYTSSYGAGDYDMYLLKLDSNGILSWSKTYGGTISETVHSHNQTSDGGYIITGSTNSYGAGLKDVYLIKTDIDGNLMWSKTFGNSNSNIGYHVEQTTDGGYIISGRTADTTGWDVYLIKTDANGTLQWSKNIIGPGNEEGFYVKQTTDGSYIILGYTIGVGTGYYDVYLIKTDTSGNVQWTKTYGSTDSSYGEFGYSIQQTFDNGYIICGYVQTNFSGPIYVLLIKIDEFGNIQWNKIFGNGDELGYSVQETSDGGYIVAGKSFNLAGGNWSAYLIKTTNNGFNGCYEDSLELVTTSPIWIVNSGEIIDSGAIVTTPATIVTNPATIDSVLCFSSCNLPIPAFTYKITSDGSSFEVNFIDSTVNADTWFWDFGDGVTDTVQSPTHIYTDSAIYNVCLTVSNSCGSDVLCEPVNVSCELPVAGFTSTVYSPATLTVNFLDTSINVASWFWNFGDGFQSTQQDTSHTYADPGLYNVCLTVSNDCGFDTLCKTIVVFTYIPGMNEFGVPGLPAGQAGLKFKVYPNPGRGIFTIETLHLNEAEGLGGGILLKIFNIFGQQVAQNYIRSLPNSDYKFELDLSNLPPGLYHLEITTDKEIANVKLIIE